MGVTDSANSRVRESGNAGWYYLAAAVNVRFERTPETGVRSSMTSLTSDPPARGFRQIGQSPCFRYGVAVFASGLALSLAFWMPVSREAPYVFFLGGVILTALYAGLGPALLNTGLAAVAVTFFFVPPYRELSLMKGTVEDTILLSVFLMVALVTGCLTAGSRRARKDAWESEEWYRSLTGAASDAIVVVREDEKIIFVNPAGEKLFGYAAPLLIGRQLSFILPAEDYRRSLSELANRCLDTRKPPVQTRMEARQSDGRQVPIEVSFGGFRQKGGRLFTAVIREVGISSALRKELTYVRASGESEPLIRAVPREGEAVAGRLGAAPDREALSA